MSRTFTKSWVGYDLPYQTIESHPQVQAWRKQGIEKRVKSPEYHITVAFFNEVSLDALEQVLQNAAQKTPAPLTPASFTLDASGTMQLPQGKYVYLAPHLDHANQALFLRTALRETPLYEAKNCNDLHVSIGGADPFSQNKPANDPLHPPLSLEGRLIFVGFDGVSYQRFAWDVSQNQFVLDKKTETNPRATNRTQNTDVPPRPSIQLGASVPVHTIAIYPKIQADTAAAVYILKSFGQAAFPGIERASIVFCSHLPEGETPASLEAAGTLMIDLGGRFDHHHYNAEHANAPECVSGLVAAALNVDAHPALKKLLAWAKRDDLQGKGTISPDPLDRAFGLSGIIMNFNREYRDQLDRALAIIVEIIAIHVREEHRRQIELPQEWEQLLATGKGRVFEARQGSAILKCAVIESGNTALPGFLRAAQKMDLIVQRAPTGHTNLITQQLRSLDLQPVVSELRRREAEKQGLTVDPASLGLVGRHPQLAEWYYDNAANTVQNGGIDPQNIPATKLPLEEIIEVIKRMLPRGIIGQLKREKEARFMGSEST